MCRMEKSPDGINKEAQIISSPRIKGGLTATTMEAFEKWIRELSQDKFPVLVRKSGAPEIQFDSANDLADKYGSIQEQFDRAGFVDFYRPKHSIGNP